MFSDKFEDSESFVFDPSSSLRFEISPKLVKAAQRESKRILEKLAKGQLSGDQLQQLLVEEKLRAKEKKNAKKAKLEADSIIPPSKDLVAFSNMRTQQDMFWWDSGIDPTKDAYYYFELETKYPQYVDFFERVIASLIPIDNVVINNNENRLKKLCRTPEQSGMVAFMIAIEIVHKCTYQKFLEKAPLSDSKKNYISCLSKVTPIFKEWSDFCDEIVAKGSDSDVIIFNCLLEGLYVPTIMSLLFFFNTINLFQLLIKANQSIFADEDHHLDEDVYLAQYVGYEKKRTYEITSKFVWFIERLLKEFFFLKTDKLEGLKGEQYFPSDYKNFAEYQANHVLQKLSLPPLFSVKKLPISYMEQLLLMRGNNHFERDTGNYFNTPGVIHEEIVGGSIELNIF